MQNIDKHIQPVMAPILSKECAKLERSEEKVGLYFKFSIFCVQIILSPPIMVKNNVEHYKHL